jgi:hypothetical protein
VPVALRKGKVRRGEPSQRREFAKLHAFTKLDRLAMNFRISDALKRAHLQYDWVGVECVNAEALRCVQRMVAV